MCGRGIAVVRHVIDYILWDGDAIERVFAIIPFVYHCCSLAPARVVVRCTAVNTCVPIGFSAHHAPRSATAWPEAPA